MIPTMVMRATTNPETPHMATWRWSGNPGAYETHLIRRYNNPYFPLDRRVVLREDVEQARKKDIEDCVGCFWRLKEVGTDARGLGANTIEEIKNKCMQLNKVIILAQGIGSTATQVATEAYAIQHALHATLQAIFASQPTALDAVNKATLTSHNYTRLFGYPVVAQILRDDSPILPQEIAATIASESPLSIAIAMDGFNAPDWGSPPVALPRIFPTLVDFRSAVLELLYRTRAEGYRDMQFDDKLTALGRK